MKNRTDLFRLFAELEDQFDANPEATFRRLEMFKDGKNDALIEELKTKFIGKFIDAGITAHYNESKSKTIVSLLDELEAVLAEKGITMGNYDNGKFYHPDTLSWFPDETVPETSPELLVALLHKSGMTEGEMFAEVKVVKKEYEHLLADYIRATIFLVKSNFFSKKNTWVLGFLKNKRKSDNVSCKFCAYLNDAGKFYLVVDKVRETNRWGDDRHGLFLSNKPSDTEKA